MAENFLKKTTIVFIDDNKVISSVFRNFLEELEPLFEVNFKIHTAEDGIEGLGFVFTTNPDIIIIDSSIPKYSGQEVLDFLTSNPNFKGTKVITINDHKSIIDLNSLSKSEPNFLGKLFQKINKKFVYDNLTRKQKFKIRFLNSLILWANLSDRFYSFTSKRKSILKLFGLFSWLLIQIVLSIQIIIARLILTYKKPERVIPFNLSFLSLRNKATPSFAIALSIALILIFQVSLFTFGGIKLFNSIRIESIFATGNNEESFTFNTNTQSAFIFDSNLIEVSEEGLALKNLSNTNPPVIEQPVTEPPKPTEPESYPIDPLPTIPEEQAPEPVEAPPMEEDITPPQDNEQFPESYSILGLSDSAVNNEVLNSSNYQYSTEKPYVITKESISFSNIQKILEVSSINDAATSIESEAIKEQNLTTDITYQISPDGEIWYYYSHIDSAWARTEIGYVTSNPIQVINQNIDTLNSLITSKEIFLKIFLVSDGSSTAVLKEIVIEKYDEIVSLIDEPVIEEPVKEEVISKLDFSKLQPYIFNASYVNGNKVVLGKLLLNDKAAKVKYEISEEDLKDFKAHVYFSNFDSATKNSFIGETDLYLNHRGEIEFLLITPSTDGGFITAEILYDPEGGADLPPLPGQTSELASPVENSTFTIDSTGDEADLSAGNGLCLTSLGTCTLRAAIAEANALAGNDNIYFNIPTSDTGYRDYETPNTASSGDSLGGDDYWTIRPATALPTITTTITIDGSTQTTNQTDTNTSGPEIEIAGISLGAGSNGFNITGSGVNVNSVVMNRFESQIQLSATTANNFVVTRSYFGIDVKAAADYTTTQKYGVNVNTVVTGIIIGNDTTDGNVFGGFDVNAGANEDSGVHLVCGTSVTAQQVQISGNYFGMSPDGTISLPNFYGIWSRNNCDLLVGGDTAAERNYIGNSTNRGISLRPANTNLPNIRIFNNYFGTDSTATQSRPNNSDILLQGSQDYTGAQNPIMIGDTGKGNLFLNPTTSSLHLTSYRRIDIAYNSFLSYQGISVIMVVPAMTPTVLMTISNNYFSTETSSDPYFGVAASVPMESQPSLAIEMDRDPVIKGNLFEQHHVAIRVNPTRVATTIAYRGLSQPVIGGTSPFSGSLCGGVEKNCFSDLIPWEFDDFPNPWPGYIQTLSNPIDESLFITNNDISDLNPTDILISRMWFGSFELFSGTNRRTDLTNNTYDLPFPSGYEVIWFHAPIANYAKGDAILTRNVRLTCTIPANCPASGATNGVSGQTTMITHFGYFSSFVYMLEHNRLVNGTITDAPGNLKFENNHQSSQTFSFDGDSTTHPVVGDRAEPWTNDTLADADINDGTVGALQLMEVEIVDANPIWDGSKWLIVVDSTTFEDNVSTCGYDDGAGTYTGGGCNGPDGLPNGKTSLKEAIYVANQLPTNDTKEVLFCIPDGNGGSADGLGGILPFACGTGTADPNFTSGRFNINITSGIVLQKNNIHISADQDYNWISPGTYPAPSAKPRIVINSGAFVVETISSGSFALNGIEIKGIKVIGNANVSRRIRLGDAAAGLSQNIIIGGTGELQRNVILNGTRNIWLNGASNSQILGNYVGVDDDGLTRQSNNSDLSIVINRANGPIGSNNIVGSPGNGRNIISGGGIGLVVATDNSIVQNNYIGVGYDGITSVVNSTGFSKQTYDITGLTIGGTFGTEGNLISGNTQVGIDYFNNTPASDSLVIKGNIIGTDINGAQFSAVQDSGIIITRSQGWQFGGSLTERNVISGNNYGVQFNRLDQSPIIGINYIGLNNDATADVPNSNSAIRFTRNAQNFNFDYTNLQISDQHQHVFLLDNSLGAQGPGIDFTNPGLSLIKSQGIAIDIKDGGATEDVYGINVNDVDDLDTGANDLMNHPLINKPKYLGSNQFLVKGIFDGNPLEAPFTIDICVSDNHISGHGNCELYVDSVTILSDGSWSKTVTVPGATGNETFTAFATNVNGSSSEFGTTFLSDADPELDGSDWVIVVNTTSDEDNVGTVGYDDGDGTYSGGGLSGPSGSANGQTSLREAILVANNFPQPVRIEFDIPTTDTGYRDLDDPDTYSSGDSLDNDDFWKIEPLTGLPSIFDDITIDGESQEINQGDNFAANLSTNYLVIDSSTTLGTDIIIDFQSIPAASLQVRGNNITIQKIGITGSTSSQRSTNVGTSSDVTFDQVEWFDNDGNALEIYNSNSGTMTISNSLFRTNGPGNDETITATSASDLQITDNIFYNNSSISIFVQENVVQSTIENNFFIDNSIDSPAPQIWFYGASNALVNNNFFYNNQDKGIVVSESPTPSGITIENNFFNANLGIAIDLEGGTEDSNGSSENDIGDTDLGPNDLMNYPVIETVTYLGGGAYKVEGDLDGYTGEAPFDIEVCEAENHSSNHGGCLQTLAFTTVNSPWEVIVTFPGDEGDENRILSAIATNVNGSTSEFSENFVAIDSNPDYIIVDYPVDLVSPGDTQEILNTTVTLTWEANDDPDIDKYEIYFGDSELNMIKIGEVDASTLEFIVNDLDIKDYYWQVVGLRANNTVGGISPIYTFTIVEEDEPTPLPEPIPDPPPQKPNNAGSPNMPTSYPVSSPVSYPTPPDYIDVPDIEDVPVSGDGVDTNADIKEGNGLFSTILISIIFSLILFILFILKRTGRVIDSRSHRGIANALIQIFDVNNKLIATTNTDDAGYFRLSLRRGNYHIFITHDTYKTLNSKYNPRFFKTIHKIFRMDSRK